MANQETLTKWLLSHQNELDLRVSDCSWIRSIFPGWHDLDVSVTIAGQRFNGRGSSHDGDTALCKAFCESVERFVCSSHGISSHGVAGHVLPEEAKANARLEYIERRSLAHQVANHAELVPAPVEERIQKHYAALGIKLDLYAVNTIPNHSVMLCIANGNEYRRPFGGILGLGAHANTKHATEKALVECLRNLEAYIQEPLASLPAMEFQKIAKPTGSQRQALLRDLGYFRSAMESFERRNLSGPHVANGSFEPLEIRDSVLRSCPLQFFRFSDGSDQPLELDFVG